MSEDVQRKIKGDTETAARRALFLAEASRVLASSLDYEATLVSLARLSVPAIADWCAVDVLTDDGEIRRLAIAHADPETERVGRMLLERYPLKPDARHGVPRVLRTGEPEMMEEIPTWALDRAVSEPDDRALVTKLALRSVMIVPLRARGRVVGAISLLTAESRRQYGAEDLRLAEDLAHRAALAVDNARLFRQAEQRRRTAEELSRVTRMLTESLDVGAVAQRIVETALTIFAAQSSVLRVRESDGSLRRLAFAGTWVEEPTDVVPPGTAVLGRAVRDGKPAWSSDLLNDPDVGLTGDLRRAVTKAGARSALAVPLQVEGSVIGALAIGCNEPRTFTASEVALLQTFADQAAIALRNIELIAGARAARADAQAAERRANFLAEASRVLAGLLDVEETLDRLAHMVVPALADWCVVYVVAEDGTIRRLHTTYAKAEHRRLADEFHARFGELDADATDAHVVRALRDGEAELVPEITESWLEATVRHPERLRLVRELAPTSVMVVPLVARGRTLGVLTFVMTDPVRRYGPADLALARDLASRAALAADNARLFRESEQRRAAAEALAAIGRALNETLEPDSVAQRIVENVCTLLHVQSAVVYRLADSGTLTSLAVAGNVGPAFRERFLLPRGIGTVGLAIRERRPVVTPNLLADDRIDLTPDVREQVEQAPHRAVLAVPLLVKGRVIGALMAGDRVGRVYSEDDVHLAQAFADQAAVALENAELYRSGQEANRTKDDFLATLSHELRTPLQAILGWLTMLRSGRLDETASRRALDTIERNTRMQTQLVDDLLDVSRIVTGKMHLEVRAVEIARVIEAALDAVRPAADAKGIRISTELDRRVGPVWGDASRLQQIVWNLVSNAVKFTARGGDVEVRLEPSEAGATITVRDTGCGVAPEVLERLFQPFWQADASATRRHGGLGLGLAIARQLVEVHGGTIEASSPGEGKGTTFTVRLPVMDMLPGAVPRTAVRTPTPRDPASRGFPSLRGLRVLVVEDEADSRELLLAVLHLAGAEPQGADSADAALEAMGTFAPDVLVADIAMPGKDGYELIRTVRARGDRHASTPALAVTAYARTEDRERALEAGFDAYVSKPVEPAEVCRLVAKLMPRAS